MRKNEKYWVSLSLLLNTIILLVNQWQMVRFVVEWTEHLLPVSSQLISSQVNQVPVAVTVA